MAAQILVIERNDPLKCGIHIKFIWTKHFDHLKFHENHKADLCLAVVNGSPKITEEARDINILQCNHVLIIYQCNRKEKGKKYGFLSKCSTGTRQESVRLCAFTDTYCIAIATTMFNY